MNDYKEFVSMIFEFGKDTDYFANEYAGTMPSHIKPELQDLMFEKFGKEIDEITQQKAIEVKFKKKFYTKLLRAKKKLVSMDKADAWFDIVFQKYFNRGILEHLIVYAIKFLYKNDLFVPKRLLNQVGNDELLAEFTASACDYLGWTIQNEPVEESTVVEEEFIDEQSETEETPEEVNETDVVSYESKEVQPVEQPSQPVVKVERTVTHEVATVVDVEDTFKSELPPFFRPGGKSSKKD